MLLSHKKECIWASSNEADEPRAYYTEWGKLERERWISYAAAAAKSLQPCLTLCDPIDGSPPGSTAPGILQARTLKWVAISFSNKKEHIWVSSNEVDEPRAYLYRVK